ncbi:MAG: hypothetical protein RIC55_22525 [Pirellulaceae bacterium]
MVRSLTRSSDFELSRWFVAAALVLLAAALLTSMGNTVVAGAGPESSAEGANWSAGQNEVDVWRRTTRGWERMSSWQAARPRSVAPPPLARISPLLPAALMLLISVAALLAFTTSPTARSKVTLSASRR